MANTVTDYGNALEEFLTAATKLQNMDEMQGSPAMRNICNALRIGTLEIVMYRYAQDESKGAGETLRVFASPKTDRTNDMMVRKVTGGGSIVVYHIYALEGDQPWTNEEQARIRTFLDTLQTFEARNRLDKLAEKLTYYDRDFGIPNLPFFMRQLGILAGQGRIAEFGAAFFDFARFSVVNAQVGRAKGTEIMATYLKMLQSKLGSSEYVCRIGGDNYALLFRKEHLMTVKPFLEGYPIVYDDVTGEKMMISTRAGYYMIEEGIHSPEQVMDRISTAHSLAKGVLRQSVVFYDSRLGERREFSQRVENAFPKALENEEYLVYYQPKISLEDYRLSGAEALCRWKTEDELLPPDAFIPILEQGKNICKLDYYMLEHVCRDLRKWLDAGKEIVPVSVNLSRRHMGTIDLVDHLLDIIDRYRIPHEYIQIELTETTSDVSFHDLKMVVNNLRDAGISVAMDDFGVGYSSINLLREAPWSVLKLDRSFLPDGTEEDSSRDLLIHHVIAMAQDLGIDVIAEGVETIEQTRSLQKNGCNQVQGFFFDYPVNVIEFEQRLGERMSTKNDEYGPYRTKMQ